MNNKQRLYEIQLSVNGESFLLTKETHSPFVRSDVFALADYKRTMVTLLASDGMVLNGGKVFFDCDLNAESKVITHAETPFLFEKNPVDFTVQVVKEPTLMDKIFGFLKKNTVGAEKFPSSSFICTNNGDDYHFIGALNESSHAVYFDILPRENKIVCKVNSENLPVKEDSLLFDIIEIEGSKEFIIETFYSLVKKLYKTEPKTSPQINVLNTTLQDCDKDTTLALLKTVEEYALLVMENENADYSISSYIQKCEEPLRKVFKHASDKILPVAVISPLLCDKNAVEYELFSGDLVKNAKGKPITVAIEGKNYFVFDIFSKSIRAYLTRQLDILFSIGFCGVKFNHLDLALKAKRGKSAGETASFAFDFLSRAAGDKLTFASGAHPNIASSKFDYFAIAKDVAKIDAPQTEIQTSQSVISWNFNGFENLVSYFDVNKKYPQALPVAVSSDLLACDPMLFDLCTACNMLACKCTSISNPTLHSIERSSQFDFMKDADVTEIIRIDKGRYAIVFYFEDIPNVCFFNFTKSDWIMDDITVKAFSFMFQE